MIVESMAVGRHRIEKWCLRFLSHFLVGGVRGLVWFGLIFEDFFLKPNQTKPNNLPNQISSSNQTKPKQVWFSS